MGRRALLAAGGGLAAALALPRGLLAQTLRFFRIGTGSTSGTYFPVGSILASALSSPPGSRSCEEGGSCGVPGMIVVAQSTHGSVANVRAIAEKRIESGFSQSDIAFWAYHGEGIFSEAPPADNLRTIASLYPEAVHVVARQTSEIRSIGDLKGKRVSLDREGSGTRVDAINILKAHGVGLDDLEAESLAPGAATDKLQAGELDAFFFIAGTPATAIIQLAKQRPISLLPISGEAAETLLERYPFFTSDRITAGTYFNVSGVETLSVGAQWLVRADISADLIYQLTRSLWHENTQELLKLGHPKGALITADTALDGLAVPLHEGAVRYYREAGILDQNGADSAISDGIE